MDKPKLLEKSTLLPRDISGQMRRKYQEELSRKEPEDRQASNTYAVDRLEEAGTAVAVATGTAGKRAAGYARAKMKEKRQQVKERQFAEEQTFAETPEQAQGGTAYQSRGKQYAIQQSRLKTRETLEADRTSAVAFERHGLPYRSPAQRQAAAKGKALPDGKRKAETTRQMKQAQAQAAHHAKTRLAVKKQMGKKLSPGAAGQAESQAGSTATNGAAGGSDGKGCGENHGKGHCRRGQSDCGSGQGIHRRPCRRWPYCNSARCPHSLCRRCGGGGLALRHLLFR